jgi:hypothetical protein
MRGLLDACNNAPLTPPSSFDIGIKIRYTPTHYREGKPMKLMVFLVFWYAVAFGTILCQVAWNRGRAGKPARPQASGITLTEGETIVAVADGPGAIRFYISTDVVDEKSYE